MNIGIIGAGRIGKLHAKNIVFHFMETNVEAISDLDLEAAKQCAQKYHIPKFLVNYHDILNDKSIDAVFICTPTVTHSQIICECAEAGKHIFCEKPIDINLERIDCALEAVKKANVKLQIGFNRRFDPSFIRAKNAIKEGNIGKPYIVRITSRDPAPPAPEYIKTSGGLLIDTTIHDFDMCRYLIEDEIQEIYATGDALIEPTSDLNDIDTVIITIRYRNGAFCTIDNSRKAIYGYDQRIEVFGSEGCINVDNRYPNSVSLYTADNIQKDLPYHFFLDRYQKSYIAEERQFIKSIKEDLPTSPSGLDGKIAVEMGLAAKKSLEEKRTIPFK